MGLTFAKLLEGKNETIYDSLAQLTNYGLIDYYMYISSINK